DKPIVGGTPVGSPDIYPWLVALRTADDKNGHCGGSLITPTKILTAAHCTVGVQLSTFKAYYHRYDTKLRPERENATTFKVKKFIVHPKYTDASNGYDIAIWDVERVSGPIPTKFAKLDDGSASVLKEGQSLTVAGWGTISTNGPPSSVLLETTVPMTSKDVCLKAYPSLAGVPSAFCAGYPEGGKDSCQQDSGGPAFVKNEDGTVTVAGIVSFGTGCALAGYPGVYATV
ncbi:trypsin-like cysteine/serine peptidase domain-containing protein, partial [Globomyces pollinis-pini]